MPLIKVWTAISTCSTSMNCPNSFHSMDKKRIAFHENKLIDHATLLNAFLLWEVSPRFSFVQVLSKNRCKSKDREDFDFILTGQLRIHQSHATWNWSVMQAWSRSIFFKQLLCLTLMILLLPLSWNVYEYKLLKWFCLFQYTNAKNEFRSTSTSIVVERTVKHVKPAWQAFPLDKLVLAAWVRSGGKRQT